MARATWDGRKTQTRRIMNPQPFDTDCEFINEPPSGVACYSQQWKTFRDEDILDNSPFGKVGDLLYVRETLCNDGADSFFYKAGGQYTTEFTQEKLPSNWFIKSSIPSIHMPRWASRMTLEIEDIRVERLQDISEVDAKAEGAIYAPLLPQGGIDGCEKDDACMVSRFAALWESINGKGSWQANPWVWAITYKLHKCNVDTFLKEQ